MASQRIYAGLLDRGFPPHIAQGIMDNFVAESGLVPDVEEVEPLVPGSRGGRGIYQLTGPRRRDYEAEYGTGYDIDSQLDWLVHEATGPEKRAMDAVMSAPDRETATQLFSQRFLRPHKDNSASRVGLWRGGGDGGLRQLGDRRAMPLEEEDEPSWFDETALGKWRSEKIDPVRERWREKLGLNAKQAEGLGGGLQQLGMMMMGL